MALSRMEGPTSMTNCKRASSSLGFGVFQTIGDSGTLLFRVDISLLVRCCLWRLEWSFTNCNFMLAKQKEEFPFADGFQNSNLCFCIQILGVVDSEMGKRIPPLVIIQIRYGLSVTSLIKWTCVEHVNVRMWYMK